MKFPIKIKMDSISTVQATPAIRGNCRPENHRVYIKCAKREVLQPPTTAEN
jgi:hypothetical protein